MSEENIKSNIIPYSGFPFSKPLELIIYQLQDENSLNFSQIGTLLRNLRRNLKNRNKIIFQMGKIIYSSDFLDEINGTSTLESLFKNPSERRISVSNQFDKLIIKNYVGELVAHSLRNKRGNWRISKKSRTIFQAIFNEGWENYENVICCEAFEYEPFIFNNGALYIAVEPRLKLFMNYNLRINDFREKSKFASYIYEYCSIECEEKSDAYSPCKISTPEFLCSIRDLVIREDKTPSTYPIRVNGENISLKDYYNLEIACSRKDESKRLGNFIEERPVFEIIFKKGEETKKYAYPAERLRFAFDYRLIDSPYLRRRLMKKLILPPQDKWNKFVTISKYLDNLTLDNERPIVIEENFINKRFPLIQIHSLEKATFLLNDAISQFPKSKLKPNGPYDLKGDSKRSFEKIKFILIYFSKIEKNLQLVLENRLYSHEPNYLSLSNLFRIESEIILRRTCLETTKIDNIFHEIQEFQISLLNNEKLVLLLIYDPSKQNLIDTFKKFSLNQEIPSQGINSREIKRRLSDDSNLLNIFLGIYSKLGGKPWIIRNYQDSNDKIIAFHKIFHKSNVSYCLLLYSSDGSFITGKTRFINKNVFLEDLSNDLISLTSLIKDRIIFLGLGNQDPVSGAIIRDLKQSKVEFSYYEINQGSNIRLFQLGREDILPARNGNYIKIEESKYFLQTSYFEEIVPTTIKVIKLHSNNNISNDLQIIYNLSQFTPYFATSFTQSLPLPLHVTKRAIKLIEKYNLNLDKIKIPFFY